MVMALLAIVLLMALLLWVINLGQQLNHRMATQNGADAAAQAGASWLARSMNTVAMNNAEMARLLAMLPVLDAMPQAVDYANREDQSLRDSLYAQLSRGVSTSPAVLKDFVEREYTNLHDDIVDDIEDLTPVDDLFRSWDVSAMTYYADDGQIWRSLTAMDELNQATMTNLGSFAQSAAIAAGNLNMGTRDVQQASFILPLEPTVPHQRGTFNDFLLPTLRGMLPPEIDDPVVRRGPWDTVQGWRTIIYDNRNTGGGEGGNVGSRNVASGGNANNPLSRRPSSDNTGGGGGSGEPVAYRTWGPYSWMLDQMADYDNGALRQTRLDHYLRRIADRKINYVWPGSRPNREVVDPEWVISYDEARRIAADGDPRIYETAFFVVEIKSKYPPGDGRFLREAGSYALVQENDTDNPRIAILRRWQDPARWRIRTLNNYVWRDDWEYTVYWDAEIGLPPLISGTNDDGTPVFEEQTVYRVDHIAFAGVNVGPAEEVRNPYEGFDPLASSSPAPMNLRHDTLAHDDEAARWQYLSVLGVAKRDDLPQGWPTRFRGGRPYPGMVALAQARVFNNHSWDLWTQMWHAELEPVSRYDDWLNRFDQMPSGSIVDLDLTAVDELRIYLNNARDLAEVMLVH